MRSFEDIAVEVETVGDLVNAISMLVRPINTDINGQGVPTYESISGAFLAIVDHTQRIAEDLRQYEWIFNLDKENNKNGKQ